MGAKQGTTQPMYGEDYGTGNGGLGNRNESRLNAAYASSPVITQDGQLADSALKAWYQDNVLDGVQDKNTLVGAVDMDFGAAPNIDDVATGGEGKPAGQRVPNTASPGDGNGSNATAQPAVDPVAGHEGDLGSVTSPSATSTASGQGILSGIQTPGKSPASS